MEWGETQKPYTDKCAEQQASSIAMHADIELTPTQLQRYCELRQKPSPEHTQLSDQRLLFNLLTHNQQKSMCEAYPHIDFFETYPHCRILGPALENLATDNIAEMSLTELLAVKNALCSDSIEEAEPDPKVAQIDYELRLRYADLYDRAKAEEQAKLQTQPTRQKIASLALSNPIELTSQCGLGGDEYRPAISA